MGNPAPLIASQLGLPAGSIASGMTIGKARVKLQVSQPWAWPTGGFERTLGIPAVTVDAPPTRQVCDARA